MTNDEFDSALRATLEDGRLSRGERQALSAVLSDLGPDRHRLAEMRARAFALATEHLRDPNARQILDWVEDLVKLLARVDEVQPSPSRAYFSPGDGCLNTILRELGRAQSSADICVFTITDDRIAEAILSAHRRGVKVRIISDDDKQFDEGSDMHVFAGARIPVRFDRSDYHMHHKFAVLDELRLLNGSYNWTRSAAEKNEENIVLTEERVLVAAFSAQFASLWDRFGS